MKKNFFFLVENNFGREVSLSAKLFKFKPATYYQANLKKIKRKDYLSYLVDKEVTFVGRKSKFSYVNKAYSSLLGLSPGEKYIVLKVLPIQKEAKESLDEALVKRGW